MDNSTSEIERFVTLPGSSVTLIERCLGPFAVEWAEQINQLHPTNVSSSKSIWIIGKQLAHLRSILYQQHHHHRQHHNHQANETAIHPEMDQNCPMVHAQSTIAHTSLAVGTAALVIHILLVFSINHGLVRLYGPCLLFSIALSALHNLLLFVSSYFTSDLETFLQISTDQPTNQTRREATHSLYCPLMDASVHYLSISVHLSTLFALMEQYSMSVSNFLSSHLSGASSRPHMGSPVREIWKTNKCRKIPQCNISLDFRNHPSKIDYEPGHKNIHSFPLNSCSRNFGLHSDTRRESGKTPLRSCSFLKVENWCWLGPLLSVILPSLPVGFGLWLSRSYGLENLWNPTYGVLTCGSVGTCLAGMQLLLYLPLGLIFVGQITLMCIINMKSDSTPDLMTTYSMHLPNRSSPDFGARCCMLTKLAGSQLIVWITAFVSNYVCLVTMWQLYAIFTGLQGLYVCVSFTFARPFLEIVFRKNDPLSRLKLDNLVMQLPLGLVRGTRDAGYFPRNSSSALSGMGVSGQPSSFPRGAQKSRRTRKEPRPTNPGRQLNTSLLNYYGVHQC
ncbi:hypothetical protein FBUS_06625 [Fasciolopsis buskii]|uniref:Uncharacterized protein n=1 Tax=Fasciolopsis buskii TaxID=27845 RepID=A0A8E0VS35_9TREM|nr:hypothetical protein FBUS_06625 [Fasciolopsis buski]